MVDSAEPVVQTAGLCKTFKDFWRRPRVHAVKDLDLTIRPGEVFGLLGPNGSGKSTTIKMLLGLLYPSKGRIAVFGKPPTDVAVKARIGFLPEESYLYRFLVAHETLDFYGRLFRIPGKIRRERIDRLLDMVGLRHEAKRPIGEYSKGMARRIGLAQALINDPEFLILDEPTAGLDPMGVRQIKDLIRKLGDMGKTILLSSHMLADVEDVCDRVTVLYGGQQMAAGDLETLLARQDKTLITTDSLSEETIDQVRRLIRRLEDKDIGVSYPRNRLEDFFLTIVRDAEAADVHTSGARGGGELPAFLAKPAETGAKALLDSLIIAAERPAPEPILVETPAGPTDDEAARTVVDRLAREADGPRETDQVAETAQETNIPAETLGSREVEADRGVIDSLLGDADKREDGA